MVEKYFSVILRVNTYKKRMRLRLVLIGIQIFFGSRKYYINGETIIGRKKVWIRFDYSAKSFIIIILDPYNYMS